MKRILKTFMTKEDIYKLKLIKKYLKIRFKRFFKRYFKKLEIFWNKYKEDVYSFLTVLFIFVDLLGLYILGCMF